MRLNLLSYASGLGVIAGAMLWPTPSPAQGFCYMVDAEGTVINLDSLCQGNDTPSMPAVGEPQAVTTGGGEVQQSPSPNVRSFTIIAAPSTPGSGPGPDQAPSAVDPTTPQPTGADSGLGSTTPQATPTPGAVPAAPQLTPAPVVVPATPQSVPSPGVAPTGPEIVPSSRVAPTTPRIVPSPRVAPTGPQIAPSPGVAPAAPQPTGTDAGLAPTGSAVEVDGAGNNTGNAAPAGAIRVPAIVVPGIPVPGNAAP